MKALNLQTPRQASNAGFSLVEITMALAVAAFCLLTVLALIPVGLNSNRDSIEQTAAAGWAAAVSADLRATPVVTTGTAVSPLYNITVPSPGANSNYNIFLAEDGRRVATANDARYRANLWFYPPAAGKRAATGVRILITWPALADPVITSNPSKYSGSLEAMLNLDRN